MPQLPVDDHSAEFEQLAGLHALDVLEGDERTLFEQHAAGCERCRLMVRLDRAALTGVSLAAPEMDPSPDFKARLMRRAAAELAAPLSHQPGSIPADAPAAPSPTAPIPLRPRAPRAPDAPRAARGPTLGPVLPFWRRSPWLSTLAALFVVALLTAGGFAFENQTVASYALSGNAPGSATVVIRRSGAAELDMSGIPDPGPGFVYEAWVIPPNKQPVAAGITTTGEARLPLTGDLRGSTVAITRERGRVDAPTSPPLMMATVQL